MVSMDSIKSSAVMKLLLLLFLGRSLGVVRSNAASDDEAFGQKSYTFVNNHVNESDLKMIRRIENEMLALNRSDGPRDKRALGILLQGFMEALGYTIAPFQIGTLPNPTPAAMPASAAPPPAAAPGGAQSAQQQAPPPMPPPMTNATPAAPSPRQRETLRFTGVLNFGDHTNTSNLVSHLRQYEQIFHGPPTPAAPPPAPVPYIDPRSSGPLPEPLFVKIPLPIAPNLPPPQPPSPMPIKTIYHDHYTRKDQEEEYKGEKDDEGHHGDYEEENDKSHHREEYGNEHEQYEGKHDNYDDKHEEEYGSAEEKQEKDSKNEDKDEDKNEDNNEEYQEPENNLGKHDEPEDRVYEHKESEDSFENTNEPKNTEKEYKKNENVVKYSIENKELHDPSEVSEEVPIVGSKYNHEMYVGEPDWKKEHEDHLYQLAAEQEANAEALAEKNLERENDRSREHELDEEDVQFHNSREKEISDKNEEHAARIEANSKATPYYEEGVAGREDDYEQETKISEKPASDSQHKESPSTEVPKEAEKVTTVPVSRRREDYSDESNGKPSKYIKNYEDYDEEKEKRRNYYATLPISYDREKLRKDHTLRDSYGESLEKPGGKVDERVAGYFTMFKNPQTGVYDPTIIKKFENSRDNSDLEKGFKKILKEYGAPESKYEEYEINDEDNDKVEHRSENKPRKPSSEDYEEEKSEDVSRKSTRKFYPETLHTTECDCNNIRNVDTESKESKNPRKLVTTEPPSIKTVDSPTSYGPHYSTVKYLYEPREYDQGIIERLTSYDPPTTRRFEDKPDSIYNPSHTSVERQQAIRPTEVGLPERLATKSLLHEAEAKEIRAWPAPFDYVFDNSDRSNVVVRGATQTTLHNSHTQLPTHQTPFETTKPCKNEPLPNQFADKVQALLKDHENDNVTNRPRRPKSRGRKTKQNSHQSNRISNPPTLRTTQATIVEQRKRLSSIERPVSYRERSRTPTFAPLISETLTPHPERASIAKGPTENIRNSRRRDQSARQSTKTQATSRTKPTVKRKYSDFSPSTDKLSKVESSNYVERDGMLIIPEPTPYFYNIKVDEFTDVPESDTGKVKIKEYRNRIASVKVSELKGLHPTPMKIIV